MLASLAQGIGKKKITSEGAKSSFSSRFATCSQKDGNDTEMI